MSSQPTLGTAIKTTGGRGALEESLIAMANEVGGRSKLGWKKVEGEKYETEMEGVGEKRKRWEKMERFRQSEGVG